MFGCGWNPTIGASSAGASRSPSVIGVAVKKSATETVGLLQLMEKTGTPV